MKVLLIEDDPRTARAVSRGLGEEGALVDIALSGEEGEDLAALNDYSVIVLDWYLPDRDGLTVCRDLRARGALTPILMLTARDGLSDRVTGLDSGADDYLTKPFAFRELLARIRALLRRDGRAKDPVLRVADLEVDTVSHEVRRCGKPIELTSKEYAILEYFLRNPNRVLTRTQIAEHVWDYDFVSMSNVIDVYVGYLRRKLGDDAEPRLLRTIRGTGYQLKAAPA
jgi:two-component system, OmpR family, copper resistance phosphate regulon response regulator CusR